MFRLLLVVSFLIRCVHEVRGSQAVQLSDRRPLLRSQYQETVSNYLEAVSNMKHNEYAGQGDASAPSTLALTLDSTAVSTRGKEKGRIKMEDTAGNWKKAVLYEAGDGDSLTAAKLTTDTVARMDGMQKRINTLELRLGKFEGATNKEDASRIPTTMDQNYNFRERSVAERVRYLEQKVDGASNWLTDPQLYERLQLDCKNMTNLGTDHRICLDNFAQRGRKDCIVYDFGIRANPEFGARMMTDFGCSVRAYDPSPISKKWWEGQLGGSSAQDSKHNKTELLAKLKAAGSHKYDFHNVGAGGKDGPFTLHEYNWDQVSIFRAENDETQRGEQPDQPPFGFSLQALTLPTMMRNNNDTYIDLVKLDIEGSEYMFMQDVFDRMGCPPVGQFALEWHGFSNDPRYGSPPEINTLHNLLTACGYKMFFNHEHWRAGAGYMTDGKTEGRKAWSNRKLPPMRYALASYCKDCVPMNGQANSPL